MATYKVAVTTGSMKDAGTTGYVHITLVGSKGESETTQLSGIGQFTTGETDTCTISSHSSLGDLLLVRLVKKPYIFAENQWFCSKVQVTTPENEVVHFPCYTWLSNDEEIEMRAGKAKKIFEDKDPILIKQRKTEMEMRKKLYQWKPFLEGLPDIVKAKDIEDLPEEIRFSFTKNAEMLYTKIEIIAVLKLKGLSSETKNWPNLETVRNAFRWHKTPISAYTEDHWKEDEFFGYQVLNGYNPMAIQRCDELPSKFAVTEEMVKPFLESGSLKAEIKKGNIFLCDYRRIDGLPSPVIHGKQQHIAAPLCLLYKNPEEKLVPIAIQLNQKPSPDNPVFLPSDSEYDWLLAKMYVRNADFHEHQANSHYLRTHGLAEVFIVSTLRNLPMTHPLHKLLIPHGRYTLHINTVGRVKLFGPVGIYTEATNLGGKGQFELMVRWFSELTYSNLFLPEDISARGLESIPNFYYRDDGLKLWKILNKYARSMVEYYYPNDQEVQKDSELQAWIKDIFIHGFLERKESGAPQKFSTTEELIKFVTMMIFTTSGQHSAVNSGQFDYGGWLPNSPSSLQKPPPKTKGQSTERIFLDTLPDIATTVNGAVFRWTLSTESSDFITLGHFPVDHFYEDVPLSIIQQLQTELDLLTAEINERNKSLTVPYTYLCPDKMENSIAI